MHEKRSVSNLRKSIFFGGIASIILLGLAGWLGYSYAQRTEQQMVRSEENIGSHTAFILNIYDIIKKEYWQQITDQQLALLFQSAAQTMIGGIAVPTQDRAGVQSMIEEALQTVKPDQKDKFVTQLANKTLQNLQPATRSSLYSTEDAQELANTVNNIDPEVNLLDILNVTEASSAAEVQSSFNQKKQILDQSQLSDQEKTQQLAILERARETLTVPEARAQYATSGIEPTFSYNLISPDVVYLHLKQFSPTTPKDMQRVMQQLNQSGKPTALILDLRSNIGGAIDTMPFLLSPFIGPNQYAYDFFKQGNTTQFRTSNLVIEELKQFKQIVVLTDGNTQSSAELMASVMKKFNVAVLVGTKTKGWGTVERVFPIEKQLNQNVQYSVFLVHSLTVREDGEAIEGNGVIPDIDLANPNWESELFSYFRNQELVEAVKKLTINTSV